MSLKLLASEVADLTNRNHHTDSLILISKYLFKDEITEELERIRSESDTCISPDNYNRRYELYSELMKIGKKKFGCGFDIIYNSL